MLITVALKAGNGLTNVGRKNRVDGNAPFLLGENFDIRDPVAGAHKGDQQDRLGKIDKFVFDSGSASVTRLGEISPFGRTFLALGAFFLKKGSKLFGRN
jgi:hypothetical protein